MDGTAGGNAKDLRFKAMAQVSKTKLALMIAAAIILAALATPAYIFLLSAVLPGAQQTYALSIVLIAPMVAWGYLAKRARDPRQILYFPAMFLLISASLALQWGYFLGIAGLLLLGVAVALAGSAYAAWLLPKTRWDTLLPIELIHPLLILASRDLMPGKESPRTIRFSLDSDSEEAWRKFAAHLRSEGLFSLVWIRRNSIRFYIARVHPLPISRALWPWWLLFGSTRIEVVPSKQISLRINKQTYDILERPSQYEGFCRQLTSLLLGSFEAYRRGDTRGVRDMLAPEYPP